MINWSNDFGSLAGRKSGGSATGGPPTWNPGMLFAGAQVGSWYDISDLTSLWQDVAGTQPVTVAGQAVARVDDRSGNGNHMIQSDPAARPVYQTDGIHHWVELVHPQRFLLPMMSYSTGQKLNLGLALRRGASPEWAVIRGEPGVFGGIGLHAPDLSQGLFALGGTIFTDGVQGPATRSEFYNMLLDQDRTITAINCMIDSLVGSQGYVMGHNPPQIPVRIYAYVEVQQASAWTATERGELENWLALRM